MSCRAAVVCALLLSLDAALAQTNLSSPLYEPPVNEVDGLVTVYATFSFIKISSIDVVSANFYADFYINFAWRDDRAAGMEEVPEEMWKIDPERMNSDPTINIYSISIYEGVPEWLEKTLSDVSTIGTWLQCGDRLSGTFDGAFDLREFPFDSQAVQIIIESLNFPNTQLVWAFQQEVRSEALPSNLAVSGWEVVGVVPEIVEHPYPTLQQTYSRLILNVNLRRLPTYFVSKYVLNVCLIIAAAITTSFFISPSEADRMVSAFAAYCAIVSWIFVLVNQVPVLGYNTRLDNFMTSAFVTTIVLVMFNGLRIMQSRRESAKVSPIIEPTDKEEAKEAVAVTDAYFVFDILGHVVISLGFIIASLVALFAP